MKLKLLKRVLECGELQCFVLYIRNKDDYNRYKELYTEFNRLISFDGPCYEAVVESLNRSKFYIGLDMYDRAGRYYMCINAYRRYQYRNQLKLSFKTLDELIIENNALSNNHNSRTLTHGTSRSACYSPFDELVARRVDYDWR